MGGVGREFVTREQLAPAERAATTETRDTMEATTAALLGITPEAWATMRRALETINRAYEQPGSPLRAILDGTHSAQLLEAFASLQRAGAALIAAPARWQLGRVPVQPALSWLPTLPTLEQLEKVGHSFLNLAEQTATVAPDPSPYFVPEAVGPRAPAVLVLNVVIAAPEGEKGAAE